MIWLAAAALIALHAPDGQVIYLNPEQVTNIRMPRGVDQGHFTAATKCLVFTVDGKHFAVVESCEEIRKRMQLPSHP